MPNGDSSKVELFSTLPSCILLAPPAAAVEEVVVVIDCALKLAAFPKYPNETLVAGVNYALNWPICQKGEGEQQIVRQSTWSILKYLILYEYCIPLIIER